MTFTQAYFELRQRMQPWHDRINKRLVDMDTFHRYMETCVDATYEPTEPLWSVMMTLQHGRQ